MVVYFCTALKPSNAQYDTQNDIAWLYANFDMSYSVSLSPRFLTNAVQNMFRAAF